MKFAEVVFALDEKRASKLVERFMNEASANVLSCRSINVKGREKYKVLMAFDDKSGKILEAISLLARHYDGKAEIRSGDADIKYTLDIGVTTGVISPYDPYNNLEIYKTFNYNNAEECQTAFHEYIAESETVIDNGGTIVHSMILTETEHPENTHEVPYQYHIFLP